MMPTAPESGAHDAAERCSKGRSGDVGAAGHVEDGALDDLEADGSSGDGADADGGRGEHRRPKSALRAVAQHVALAGDVLVEHDHADDDGGDHGDIDDVRNAEL